MRGLGRVLEAVWRPSWGRVFSFTRLSAVVYLKLRPEPVLVPVSARQSPRGPCPVLCEGALLSDSLRCKSFGVVSRFLNARRLYPVHASAERGVPNAETNLAHLENEKPLPIFAGGRFHSHSPLARIDPSCK